MSLKSQQGASGTDTSSDSCSLHFMPLPSQLASCSPVFPFSHPQEGIGGPLQLNHCPQPLGQLWKMTALLTWALREHQLNATKSIERPLLTFTALVFQEHRLVTDAKKKKNNQKVLYKGRTSSGRASWGKQPNQTPEKLPAPCSVPAQIYQELSSPLDGFREV